MKTKYYSLSVMALLFFVSAFSQQRQASWHCKDDKGNFYLENQKRKEGNIEYICKCQSKRLNPYDKCLEYKWETTATMTRVQPDTNIASDEVAFFEHCDYQGRRTVLKHGYAIACLDFDLPDDCNECKNEDAFPRGEIHWDNIAGEINENGIVVITGECTYCGEVHICCESCGYIIHMDTDREEFGCSCENIYGIESENIGNGMVSKRIFIKKNPYENDEDLA